MANRTDSQADTVHGTNPQYLVDRIIRNKIYNDAYWKEFCFGLTTESLIDKAAELDFVGGTYGGRRRPAKFLCLFLKMLQIQPDEEVILEYIRQPDLKYLRALGAAYYRISQRHIKVYQTLEPLFADYRKLRFRDLDGKLSLIHMDEFIDWLFREKTVCDVTMPGLPKREILEGTLDLPPRQSVLEDDLEDLEDLEGLQATGGAEEAAAAAAAAGEGREVTPERQPEKGSISGPLPRERDRSRSSRRSVERADDNRRKKRAASRSASGSCSSRGRDEKAKNKEKRREKERERAKKEKKERKKERREDEKKEGRKHQREEKDAGERKVEKPSKKKDKDGLSVEEWNQVRKEMGLKPLRE